MYDFIQVAVVLYCGVSMITFSENIADYVSLHHERYTKGEKFRYLIYPVLSIFMCLLCLIV